MRFFTGEDYSELCEECQGAITSIAELLGEGDSEDTDDEEAPLVYCGDYNMLCGGNFCAKHRESERIERLAEEVTLDLEHEAFMARMAAKEEHEFQEARKRWMKEAVWMMKEAI